MRGGGLRRDRTQRGFLPPAGAAHQHRDGAAPRAAPPGRIPGARLGIADARGGRRAAAADPRAQGGARPARRPPLRGHCTAGGSRPFQARLEGRCQGRPEGRPAQPPRRRAEQTSLSVPGAGASSPFIDLGVRVAETLARLRLAGDVTVGCSARRAVWSRGKTTLYRYDPITEPIRGARPLLVCFALVNRPYILDLQPDTSLLRRLLAAGRSVYLIEWGDADEGDRLQDLNDYLEHGLGGCVQHLLGAHSLDAIDLMGVCQGGVFTLCYSALHPTEVANLVTLTTAVDFQTSGDLLSKWVRELDTQLLERMGNVPGELLNALFLSLLPFRLMQQKYVRLLTGRADQRAVEDFVRMERWIFDSPPQAATALAQFVRWLYQENRLMRGTLELGGRVVDLKAVRQPLLNLYASADHIVPPAACEAMGRHIGSRDYTAAAIDTGHIGMYVSRKAREEIPQRIIAWLRARSDGRARRGGA